jgi:hypothetical protein
VIVSQGRGLRRTVADFCHTVHARYNSKGSERVRILRNPRNLKSSLVCPAMVPLIDKAPDLRVSSTNAHEAEMTRQKIRKHAFEAPNLGGVVPDSLVGRVEVSDSKEMKTI